MLNICNDTQILKNKIYLLIIHWIIPNLLWLCVQFDFIV